MCVCVCVRTHACLSIWKQHKCLQRVEKNKGQWFLSWNIMQQWKMVQPLLHLTLWINLTYIYRIIRFIIFQIWADSKWLLTWQYSISKSRCWLHGYMWKDKCTFLYANHTSKMFKNNNTQTILCLIMCAYTHINWHKYLHLYIYEERVCWATKRRYQN